IVFWWLFKTMDREWWVRFLDRYGSPFLVGKYDQNDDASRIILNHAFAAATKLFGLVISKDTEVEIQQAGTNQNSDAFKTFHDVANREISKLILGQTMTAEAQPQGIGGSQALVHDEVRGDIRQFDATALGETIREQLFAPLVKVNNLPGRPPVITWGDETDQAAEATGKLLSDLKSANLEPDDEALPAISKRLGFDIRRAQQSIPPAGNPTLFAASGPISPKELAVDQAGAANLRIARAASADLAQAFRGHFAPVRAAILESQSPEDLERRLTVLYADLDPARLAPIIEQALVAFTANATQV
ncbi:MAG: DUF935 family protein, partial [Verrucomicrobiota bacterium]